MKNIKFSQQAKDAFEFRRSLTPETDRGCALMAAAYLDSQLAELLKLYFVDDSRLAKDLFEHNGPLASFSSRIDVAFALGLIGPHARRELHLIRRIRNDFGHEAKPISFDYAAIASRCRELYYHQPLVGDTPRVSFTRSVMGLLARIHGEIRRRHHCHLGKDVGITDSEREDFRKHAERIWNDLVKISRQGLTPRELRASVDRLENDMADSLKQYDDEQNSR